MQRVAVLGCGGAGKSRLAREMGRRLGLPVVHLDVHYWRPGWVPTPGEAWERIQADLLTGDAWIADGNYGGTLHLRFARADTAVFLDFGRLACYRGVLTRWLRGRGRVRRDLAAGCPECLDLEFLRWIWGFSRHSRPLVLTALASFASRGGRVVVLRSRRAVASFVETLVPGTNPVSRPLGPSSRATSANRRRIATRTLDLTRPASRRNETRRR